MESNIERMKNFLQDPGELDDNIMNNKNITVVQIST